MVNLNDGIHYNWEKTLSYNADITMVVGAPNKGKTYGLRAYALNAAIKRGERSSRSAARSTSATA